MQRVTPFIDDRGEKKYLLEWRLEDAIEALRAEGAEAGWCREASAGFARAAERIATGPGHGRSG
ncbi:MAG: hypothetical protein KatS3mg076_2676 [Candidatus Binatia bacterium]|nr:MAG: hypothetical protein KatS3mg076_2676 [Candidatus Binatia bacterium]